MSYPCPHTVTPTHALPMGNIQPVARAPGESGIGRLVPVPFDAVDAWLWFFRAHRDEAERLMRAGRVVVRLENPRDLLLEARSPDGPCDPSSPRPDRQRRGSGTDE